MQIDWKQGDILYSIFINNRRVSERMRQPLPQGYLGNLMEPNKRTGDFHRASSFTQLLQSNCKSSTFSSKLSMGTSPFPSVLSSLDFSSPVPLLMFHPWNYASPQLWKFPSHYSKNAGILLVQGINKKVATEHMSLSENRNCLPFSSPTSRKRKKREERWLCYSY